VINFRCWHCHRKYAKADAKIGTTFTCSCQSMLRVPKRDGGNCRVKTIADRVVEAVVCGGGGALLCFFFTFFVFGRWIVVFHSWTFTWVMTLAGGIAGFLGGERAIDWIGNMIRDQERN
jgi:hypothetical protein